MNNNYKLTWERSFATSDFTVLAAAHASANVSIALWKSILFYSRQRHRHAENFTQHVHRGSNRHGEGHVHSCRPAARYWPGWAPPSSAPPASRKTDTTEPSFQRFSFLSRYFNEFLFLHSSPAHVGWAFWIIYTCNSVTLNL